MVSPGSGDRFSATATWSAPLPVYTPETPVALTIIAKIDDYVWNGKNDGYIHNGLNYVGMQASAMLDSDGMVGGVDGYAIRLNGPNGKEQVACGTDNGKKAVESDGIVRLYYLFRICRHLFCGPSLKSSLQSPRREVIK